MLCNKCAGFILLFWLNFFYFSWRHSWLLYAQAWICKTFFFFFFFPSPSVICTVTAQFVSTFWHFLSLAAWHPANTCPEYLLCYCASLSLFFWCFLFCFFNNYFSVVSARCWYHCSACNHVSLIMFIDFYYQNNKIISTPEWLSCWFITALGFVHTCQRG